MNAEALLKPTLENAREKNRAEADYINPDDGLLYCGHCHTRQPSSHKLPPFPVEPPVSIFFFACASACSDYHYILSSLFVQ